VEVEMVEHQEQVVLAQPIQVVVVAVEEDQDHSQEHQEVAEQVVQEL
jgi:hypothetical protein